MKRGEINLFKEWKGIKERNDRECKKKYAYRRKFRGKLRGERVK
jgi:hypothetical protein